MIKNLIKRIKAEKLLENSAWEWVKSDSTFGEKVAACLITNAMKAKFKIGAGKVETLGTDREKRMIGRGVSEAQLASSPRATYTKVQGSTYRFMICVTIALSM